MAIIQSGASADLLTVGPTSKAAYAELRDSAGNALPLMDKSPSGIIPGSTRGLPLIGADGKTPRLIRSFSDGAQVESLPTLQFYEPVEGAAYNPNLWLQTLSTFTVTQANGVMTFNAGNSVTTAQGALHASNKFFPLPQRSKIIFKSRQRHAAHFANNVIELGLVSPTSSATSALTAQSSNGAFWQKDASGQYIPKCIVGGTEVVGTPISNASFLAQVANTEYALFEVEMDQDGAWFRIYTVAGVLVTGSEQRVDLGATVGAFTSTHFQAFLRNYNTGTVATAVQSMVGATAVYSLDTVANKSGQHLMAGLGLNCLVAPLTTFGQTANYTNNAAPTTRTVANTTEQEATLGGHVSWANGANSFGGSDTADYILFGYTVPTNYNLFIQGIRLSTVNLGAANAAAPYTIEYFLAYNHTGATLASGSPRFVPLGFQRLAASAAIGETFDRDTVWNMATPIMVLPGRHFAIGARVLAGTATASQIIRTIAAIDGWFE